MSRDPTFLGLTLNQRDALLGVASAHPRGDNALPHAPLVREWIGEFRSKPHGPQVYRALSELEGKGLIEKEPINDRENGLKLTDDGRRMLAEHKKLIDAAVPDSNEEHK